MCWRFDLLITQLTSDYILQGNQFLLFCIYDTIQKWSGATRHYSSLKHLLYALHKLTDLSIIYYTALGKYKTLKNIWSKDEQDDWIEHIDWIAVFENQPALRIETTILQWACYIISSSWDVLNFYNAIQYQYYFRMSPCIELILFPHLILTDCIKAKILCDEFAMSWVRTVFTTSNIFKGTCIFRNNNWIVILANFITWNCVCWKVE